MKPGTRYGIAAAALLCLLIIAVGANFVLTTRAMTANDRNWCATLQLLTSVPQAAPVDPAKNPSRVEGYELYVDFVKLRARFGCG